MVGRVCFFLQLARKKRYFLPKLNQGEILMTRFLGVLVVIVLIVGCVGYFLGWFTFSSDSTEGKTHITINVDRDKIKETEKKVEETVKHAVDKVKGSQTTETKTTTPP
jgi:hypothetical protein